MSFKQSCSRPGSRVSISLRFALAGGLPTSEVLRVISSSPGDLQPVFDAVLMNAVRICGAKFATLFRYDGTRYFPASHIGTPQALVEALQDRFPKAEFKGGESDFESQQRLSVIR